MAKNLFSLTDIKNKPHRDGFDLSFRNVFSAPLGQLIPVMNKMCFPGDSFKINVNWFTRTQPCTSPAYTRFAEYYDFFFVPIHYLWRYAPQFFSQTNAEQFTSALPQPQEGIQSVSVYKECPNISTGLINTFFDNCSNSGLGSEALRQFTKDYAIAYDECGYPRAYGAKRLLESLNYNLGIKLEAGNAANKLPNYSGLDIGNDKVINVLPLLAYQKIYADFYRNSQWEEPTPSSFNMDYFQKFSDAQGLLDMTWRKNNTEYYFGRSILDIAYADYPKDYFMGVLPNKQFGDTSLASPIVPLKGVSLSLDAKREPSDKATMMMYQDSITTTHNVDNFGLGISALSIRQAEFLQKWKEITQSGGTDYVSQMQKHFGVSPSSELSHRVQFLGGVSKRFGIDEVVNTNLSQQGAQATMMGKGLNVGDGNIEFKCTEHGIIMCIYHVGIQPEYRNFVDKENFKISAEDFLIPEFDNIGMQEVRRYESQVSSVATSYLDSIVGYVPRYSEYKTSVDQIHGVFNKSLVNWVTPVNIRTDKQFSPSTYPFTVSNYINFKMTPDCLNNVFGVAFRGDYETDQFLVNADFDIKAVRNISRNGLPY